MHHLLKITTTTTMTKSQSILLFPFMAKGHIIPFTALALKLERENHRNVTIVNTPLNIKKLRSQIPNKSTIRLVELPFRSEDHGLPPGSECTDILPYHHIIRLCDASASLRPVFTRLLLDLVQENDPPLCVISDMLYGWPAEVARSFGIFHSFFIPSGGFGMAIYHTLWMNLPHPLKRSLEVEEEDGFSLPGFPSIYRFKFRDLPSSLMKNEKGPPPLLCEAFRGWSKTDALLFNTVEEIDRVGLNYFKQRFSCHVCSIGPVVSTSTADIIDSSCTKWLDSKPSRSVLYVAFGSQSAPSTSQSMVLALALEASGVNFIWVARPENKGWFPEGFQERIQKSKRGLLMLEWAPQQEILSHISVGAFLTHCGWNSTIEALSNGVPMLSWPMEFEQPFNAKFLEEELGVCIRVANGIEMEVSQEDIEGKIKMIIDGNEGKDIRNRAFEVKEILKKASWDHEKGQEGSSSKQLDMILDIAMQNKTFLK